MHHINQLRSVVALAEYRHFGRAAESIGLTQSALSQSIRKVEDLYGVPLFERRNRQVALTTYGDLVYQTASQTLDAMSNVEREIRLLRNLETGHLVVHSDPYLTNSLLDKGIGERWKRACWMTKLTSTLACHRRRPIRTSITRF